MRKAVVHRRAGAAANWLGPPFRPLWLEATRALFKETSCESLKLTRRLADLVFSAQLTIAASPTRAEGRRILNEIDDLLTKAAVLIDSHDVRTLAPAVADSLAEKGASSGRVLARVARLAAQAALDLPAGAGQGRALAAMGSPTAQVQCAAAVVEVWRIYRKRAAYHTDDEARVACAALWRLAAGSVTPQVQKDPEKAAEMWDRHLRAVTRKPKPETVRRRRGDPRKLKSKAGETTAIEIARDRARAVLNGSWVRNRGDN
jgi:hypothetical protein